jgi:predicted RNA-binding protein
MEDLLRMGVGKKIVGWDFADGTKEVQGDIVRIKRIIEILEKDMELVSSDISKHAIKKEINSYHTILEKREFKLWKIEKEKERLRGL